MIESIHFRNFKALREATLPLGPFTLIVGPNGSGKSTAFQGLQALQCASTGSNPPTYAEVLSAGVNADKRTWIEVGFRWKGLRNRDISYRWLSNGWANSGDPLRIDSEIEAERMHIEHALRFLAIYGLEPKAIMAAAELEPNTVLASNGAGLVAVLDQLRDQTPERFHELNEELTRWMPEFDQFLFHTPKKGYRSLLLRTRIGQHAIPASHLSEGTLLTLAILTLSYLPNPPTIACFEEPDRGIHPRLLRRVQDALYRLVYPEASGEKREPIQVIATTHNPYFLDLFKDHPEEVVIASKKGLDATFQRVSEMSHINEILGGAPLGDIWYTGVLGGVPAEV
jgi:predicted ATPase